MSLFNAYEQYLAKQQPILMSARKSMFGLAGISIAVGAGIAYDSFRGKRDMREMRVAEIKEHAALKGLEFEQGRWSGMPFLDHMAHKLHEFIEYGPMNLNIRWQEFKVNAASLVDSIGSAFMPLSVGLGALYAGLGHEKVSEYFRRAFGAISRATTLSDGLKNDLKAIFKQLWAPIRDGLGTLSRWPLKSGANFLVATAGLLVGSFVLNKFRDVYTEETQEELFRPDVFEKHIHS
ncbi:MAG TPA: hypothetical protein V6C52_03325 [Coleofasciculaceae cyanobacterium]|jgi:hypothetical protein